MGCSGEVIVNEKSTKKKYFKSSEINNSSDISYEKNRKTNIGIQNQNVSIININKKNKKKDSEINVLSEEEKSKYRKEMFDKHFNFRKNHGCSDDFKLDDHLNKIAQDYAKNIINSNNIIYNNYTYKGEALGENIAINKGKIDPNDICDQWYKEGDKYNYSNKFQKEAIHFTQIVWKNTKRVGFGFEIKDNIYYVVALYYPAGNIFNEFVNNVGKK